MLRNILGIRVIGISSPGRLPRLSVDSASRLFRLWHDVLGLCVPAWGCAALMCVCGVNLILSETVLVFFTFSEDLHSSRQTYVLVVNAVEPFELADSSSCLQHYVMRCNNSHQLSKAKNVIFLRKRGFTSSFFYLQRTTQLTLSLRVWAWTIFDSNSSHSGLNAAVLFVLQPARGFECLHCLHVSCRQANVHSEMSL